MQIKKVNDEMDEKSVWKQWMKKWMKIIVKKCLKNDGEMDEKDIK